jgi:hypothetical protein
MVSRLKSAARALSGAHKREQISSEITDELFNNLFIGIPFCVIERALDLGT